jgi:hypothetical protein
MLPHTTTFRFLYTHYGIQNFWDWCCNLVNNFEPMAVITIRAYAPFPALLPFFKCILEVVFCEGVQHRLRFCLDHLSCVEMRPSNFIFNKENRGKSQGAESGQ